MSNIAIEEPLWLLVPVIFLLLYFARPRKRLLPAAWAKLVSAELRGFLAQSVIETTVRWRFYGIITLSCLLAAALAVISIEGPESPNPRNLYGRFLVLDLGLDVDDHAVVVAARNFLAQSPDVPSGIIAVAGQAFDVVPLTTDQAHIDRYLQVIEADMMPVPGRAPHDGLLRAMRHLQRSEIVAKQIVLFSNGAPPSPPQTASMTEFTSSIWIVLPPSDLAAWRGIGQAYGARLVAQSQSAAVIAALAARRASALRDAIPVSDRRELTPWFALFALPVWLLTFFRRRIA